MIGEVLNITGKHSNAAELIAKRVFGERADLSKNYKYIIGISGESCSGLSELSHSLAKVLSRSNIRVKVLHTDNYFKVAPLLLNEWRHTKGIDSVGIGEYDWHLLNRNIEDFKEDRESMMPCVDLIPAQVDKLITDFKKIDLLIVCGLYAIKTDGIDLRIFIGLSCSDLETKVPEDDDFAKMVVEKEHENVQLLKPMADLIVDKNFRVLDARTNTPI